MSKTFNSRIQLKTDTKANWEKATNFIPKLGEVCVYIDYLETTNDNGENVYIPGIKIGDGIKYINELEFANDDYITNGDIDEILQNEGDSTGGTGGLTNEKVTLTMSSIGSNINQGTLVYVMSLTEEGLPLYKSEELVLSYSKTFYIIKNSCFYISNSSLIPDTFSYSGNDLKELNNYGGGPTYQILNNVNLEYKSGAPM